MGRGFQILKISSSRGFKSPPKSARGKKYLPPAGLRPLGGKNFCPWANLRGFFNPGDEEISIPDNWPIRKLYSYATKKVCCHMNMYTEFCTAMIFLFILFFNKKARVCRHNKKNAYVFHINCFLVCIIWYIPKNS